MKDQRDLDGRGGDGSLLFSLDFVLLIFFFFIFCFYLPFDSVSLAFFCRFSRQFDESEPEDTRDRRERERERVRGRVENACEREKERERGRERIIY